MTPAARLLALFLDILEAWRGGIPPRFLPNAAALGTERALGAGPLPVLRRLPRVEDIAAPEARPLADLLRRKAEAFRWGQTYGPEDFGESFLAEYGWLEVFGTRGHFVHAEIAGGLLLLGPNMFYPEHRHTAEEIYLPLTGGAEWFMEGQGWRRRAAGEVVHHGPDVVHAMRTGAEPLLALYLWRGGALDQRSEIVAQPASRNRSG